MEDLKDIAAVGLIILLLGGILLAAIYFPIRAIGHNVDNRNCRAFSQQTGRETKFVDYTFLTWDCITPSTDGKWISIDNLREITD